MSDTGVTMNFLRFQYATSGREKILNSRRSMQLIEQKARDVCSRARGMHGAKDYDVKMKPGKIRAHAYVYTASRYAARSNLRHNTLLKALNSVKK